jgi:putative DNA primase/helicase
MTVSLRAIDGGRLSHEGQKFDAPASARALAEVEPYAVGGAQLYVYIGGHYQPGERHLAQRIVELLGSDWNRRRAEEITAYLRITSPELWEQPPVSVVNVANGLLDVKTRKLSPHTPEHLSPVRIAAAFDPDAKCPAADAFIASTIPELSDLVDELLGYIATPDNRYQKAFMFTGIGGTGKSTLAKLIRAFVGAENVSTVDLHRLEDDRFATADLFGKLANVFADLPSQALRSSSNFKSITGGDAIRGERKHREAFSWTPYARLIFSANEVPPTTDSTDAFFERWLILPFEHKYRGTGSEDFDLIEKLTTPGELSGLLNRALDGLARLHRQGGFSRIASSEQAAERFRVDADSTAGFCAECCNLEAGARVAKPVLFAAYKDWCEENNRLPLGSARFNRQLRERHPDTPSSTLDEVTVKGRHYWLGIELAS